MQTFVKVPHDTVLRLGEVAKTERCPSLFPVYLALLFHADRKGKCFPSYQRIKEVSGIRSDASVRKAILLLEKYGFIKKQSRHGIHGNSTYYLHTSINEETSSINKEVTTTNEKCSSMNEEPNFNECSSKLQSLKSKTSINEEELDPYNYNHITMCDLTKEKKEKHTQHKPKNIFETEEEIKELFHSLSGREMIPPEEVLLGKLLYNLPPEEVIALIEDSYLRSPTEFPQKGLFLIPNWEAYQYG